MSELAEKLKPQLLALSVEERLGLADFLYESAPDDDMPESDRAELDATIMQRLKEFESGEDPGMLAEDFFEQLRRERSAKRT